MEGQSSLPHGLLTSSFFSHLAFFPVKWCAKFLSHRSLLPFPDHADLLLDFCRTKLAKHPFFFLPVFLLAHLSLKVPIAVFRREYLYVDHRQLSSVASFPSFRKFFSSPL